MKINKEILKLIFIAIPVVGFIAYIIIGLNERNKQLEKEPEYTYAIIVDAYVGAKTKHYVKYEFEVKGQTYSGDNRYMAYREFIQIGDTCEVVYALSDPKNSELLRNKDKTLKIRK